MALLLCGAQGKSFEIMENALLLGNATQKAVANQFNALLKPLQNNGIVSIANAIYVQDNFVINSNYSALATDQFYSTVTSINFNRAQNASATINNWVSHETHGKIQNLFSPKSFRSSDTEMVLVNAIYFKGNWKYPFNKRGTTKQKFHYGSCTDNNAVKQIDMMSIQVGDGSDIWKESKCL